MADVSIVGAGCWLLANELLARNAKVSIYDKREAGPHLLLVGRRDAHPCDLRVLKRKFADLVGLAVVKRTNVINKGH